MDMASEILARPERGAMHSSAPVQLLLPLPLPSSHAAEDDAAPVEKFEMAGRRNPSSRGKGSVRGGAPKLLSTDTEGIRSVIESHPSFNPEVPWKMGAFLRLLFEHRLFKGTGRELMRHLGLPENRPAYIMFITQVLNADFLKHADVYFFSGKHGRRSVDYGNLVKETALAYEGFWSGCSISKARRFEGWRSLGGQLAVPPSPEEEANRREVVRRIAKEWTGLLPMDAFVLEQLMVSDATLEEIGKLPHVRTSKERVSQRKERALERLRRAVGCVDDAQQSDSVEDDAREQGIQQTHSPLESTRISAGTKMSLPKLLHPSTFEHVGYVDPETGRKYLFDDYDPKKRG